MHVDEGSEMRATTLKIKGHKLGMKQSQHCTWWQGTCWVVKTTTGSEGPKKWKMR